MSGVDSFPICLSLYPSNDYMSDAQNTGDALERIEEKLDLILKKLDKPKSEENFYASAKLTKDKTIEELEAKLDDSGAY